MVGWSGRLIRASSSVRRAMLRSIVVKKILSWKAKLSIQWSMFQSSPMAMSLDHNQMKEIPDTSGWNERSSWPDSTLDLGWRAPSSGGSSDYIRYFSASKSIRWGGSGIWLSCPGRDGEGKLEGWTWKTFACCSSIKNWLYSTCIVI